MSSGSKAIEVRVDFLIQGTYRMNDIPICIPGSYFTISHRRTFVISESVLTSR